MTDPILILVKSNPMKTHKPVEAVRIALGLISGELPVQIVLFHQAPMLLGEDAEDLVDGEILMKVLPSFRELGQTFYVEESNWKSLGLEPVDYSVTTVSMKNISGFVSKASHLMVF